MLPERSKTKCALKTEVLKQCGQRSNDPFVFGEIQNAETVGGEEIQRCGAAAPLAGGCDETVAIDLKAAKCAGRKWF